MKILFLTETDMVINKQEDYRLQGFNTIFHKRETENEKVRMIALINESIENQITVKENLMSKDFPSIWLELKTNQAVPIAICGIYRQWSHNGDATEKMQVKQIEELAKQIDIACETYEKVVITGDVNLCSSKWEDTNYLRKNVSRPLLECLSRQGLIIEDIGTTYQADHILKNGSIPESCLDHVYLSNEIRSNVSVIKLANSATDHLPVITKIKTNQRSDKFILTCCLLVS